MTIVELLSLCAATAVPLIAAVLAWALNMQGKPAWEKQQHKEERHRRILQVMPDFYGAGTLDDDTFGSFRKEWQLTWIYCPDDVIDAGNPCGANCYSRHQR